MAQIKGFKIILDPLLLRQNNTNAVVFKIDKNIK